MSVTCKICGLVDSISIPDKHVFVEFFMGDDMCSPCFAWSYNVRQVLEGKDTIQQLRKWLNDLFKEWEGSINRRIRREGFI